MSDKNLQLSGAVKFVGGFFYPLVETVVESIARHESTETRTVDLEDLATKITLKRDPNNQHDSNAVAVLYNDVKIGHIARDDAAMLAKHLDNNFEAVVTKIAVYSVTTLTNILTSKKFFDHMSFDVELRDSNKLWDSLTEVVEKFK